MHSMVPHSTPRPTVPSSVNSGSSGSGRQLGAISGSSPPTPHSRLASKCCNESIFRRYPESSHFSQPPGRQQLVPGLLHSFLTGSLTLRWLSRQPSLHAAAKTILLKCKSVQVMCLLRILQWISSHSGTKPAAFQWLRSPYLSCTSCSDLTSCYSAFHQAMRLHQAMGALLFFLWVAGLPLQASTSTVSPAQNALPSAINVLGSLISFRS